MSEMSVRVRPEGKGYICFSSKDSGTAIEGFKQSDASTIEYTYPLKLMNPKHASANCCQWLYPVTFGGGLVEGDKIQLGVDVEDGCSVLVTTQSSTKVFHCDDGATTSQDMQYKVGNDALLAIVPDPVVPYARAKYQQTQVVHVTANSNLVLLDWMTAGRIALSECWDFHSYDVSSRVLLGDEVVFRDAYHLADTPNLTMKAANGEYQTLGSLLIIGGVVNGLLESRLAPIGEQKPIGATYDCDEFLSISPVSFKTAAAGNISGHLLRIMAKSTAEAFLTVESVLKPLFPLFGGNPFAGKY